MTTREQRTRQHENAGNTAAGKTRDAASVTRNEWKNNISPQKNFFLSLYPLSLIICQIVTFLGSSLDRIIVVLMRRTETPESLVKSLQRSTSVIIIIITIQRVRDRVKETQMTRKMWSPAEAPCLIVIEGANIYLFGPFLLVISISSEERGKESHLLLHKADRDEEYKKREGGLRSKSMIITMSQRNDFKPAFTSFTRHESEFNRMARGKREWSKWNLKGKNRGVVSENWVGVFWLRKRLKGEISSRLVIRPGQALSLYQHRFRSESCAESILSYSNTFSSIPNTRRSFLSEIQAKQHRAFSFFSLVLFCSGCHSVFPLIAKRLAMRAVRREVHTFCRCSRCHCCIRWK